MTFLKSWLLGVVAAALAVALAQSLTPEGTVKKVGRLVGGLVLLLAVVKPLGGLALSGPALPAAYTGGPATGGEEVMKTLIAEKVGAYIVDKGSALGADCEVSVTVQADGTGWPVPWSVEIAGDLTAEQERALSRAVEEDLDIPAQRQSFRKEVP